MNNIDSIIWDWNGTLLNDVDISLSSVNQLLAARNLEPLTYGRYIEVFTFPVREYYEKIGFDFKDEPFEIAAHQYIEIYNQAVRYCELHKEAIPVLDFLKSRGLKQYILSAMEQGLLEETLRQTDIYPFFESVYGLNHQFATSKIEIGISLTDQYQLRPQQTLLIGDTVHDYEVAQSIGCQCILVANGHQSKQRLQSTGTNVIDDLSQLFLAAAQWF